LLSDKSDSLFWEWVKRATRNEAGIMRCCLTGCVDKTCRTIRVPSVRNWVPPMFLEEDSHSSEDDIESPWTTREIEPRHYGCPRFVEWPRRRLIFQILSTILVISCQAARKFAQSSRPPAGQHREHSASICRPATVSVPFQAHFSTPARCRATGVSSGSSRSRDLMQDF
jgi:hypothetical protein